MDVTCCLSCLTQRHLTTTSTHHERRALQGQGHLLPTTLLHIHTPIQTHTLTQKDTLYIQPREHTYHERRHTGVLPSRGKAVFLHPPLAVAPSCAPCCVQMNTCVCFGGDRGVCVSE